jgi:hypothetical protein
LGLAVDRAVKGSRGDIGRLPQRGSSFKEQQVEEETMKYFGKTANTCTRAHPALLSAALLSALLAGVDSAIAEDSDRADSAARVHGPLVLKAQGSFVVGGQIVSTDAATVVLYQYTLAVRDDNPKRHVYPVHGP